MGLSDWGAWFCFLCSLGARGPTLACSILCPVRRFSGSCEALSALYGTPNAWSTRTGIGILRSPSMALLVLWHRVCAAHWPMVVLRLACQSSDQRLFLSRGKLGRN